MNSFVFIAGIGTLLGFIHLCWDGGCLAPAWILVPGFRFRIEPAALAFNCLVSSQALVPLPGSSPDSRFRFRILILTCLARFSIFNVRFAPGLSCDCLTPAWIQVSGFIFQFGLAPLTSPIPVLGFRLGSRAIACLQPGLRFHVPGLRFCI